MYAHTHIKMHSIYPLSTRRCCDVELKSRRNNVVCPVGRLYFTETDFVIKMIGDFFVPSLYSITIFFRVLKSLFTNHTFILSVLAAIGDAMLVVGFAVFGPKYLENQFSLSAGAGAAIFGKTFESLFTESNQEVIL